MNSGAAIRRLREAKGWTQGQLAERLGVDVSTVSRYERNERGLSVSKAETIAVELGGTTAEVLGVEGANGVGPAGFAEDMVPYDLKADDAFRGLVGTNRYLWMPLTNVLDNVGIAAGSVVVVNDSQKARDALRPLQAVQVAYHSKLEPGKAIKLLRQFVPPGLLITNCSTGNLPSLDMNEDDAQIIAVIESVHVRVGQH